MSETRLFFNEKLSQVEDERDAKEFIEMYGKLTQDERKQVKGILIGMNLVRQSEKKFISL